jgi:hypothetical protein
VPGWPATLRTGMQQAPDGASRAMVGAEGIEPPHLPCSSSALPMSYTPSVSTPAARTTKSHRRATSPSCEARYNTTDRTVQRGHSVGACDVGIGVTRTTRDCLPGRPSYSQSTHMKPLTWISSKCNKIFIEVEYIIRIIWIKFEILVDAPHTYLQPFPRCRPQRVTQGKCMRKTPSDRQAGPVRRSPQFNVRATGLKGQP